MQRTLPYAQAADAVVGCVLEPTLLNLLNHLYVPIGFSALEKLSGIISLKITSVYARAGLTVSAEDTAAALMALEGVDTAFEYMDDLKHGIIWTAVTEPGSCLFMLSKTFSDYMDMYLSILGNRMGEGEFAGIATPPPDLTEMVFRLLVQKSLQCVTPVGETQQEIKAWLMIRLSESMHMYIRRRKNVRLEHETTILDIQYANNRLERGGFANEADRQDTLSWLHFLEGMLPNLSLKPKPFAATTPWFDDMDWIELAWMDNGQLEKARSELQMIGVWNKGIEREAARRRGETEGT